MDYKLHIPLLLMFILVHGAKGNSPNETVAQTAEANLAANDLRALFGESLAENTTATEAANDTMIMPDMVDAHANTSVAIDEVIAELLQNDTTGVIDASMLVGDVVSDTNSSIAEATNASDTLVVNKVMSTDTNTSDNATTLLDIVALAETFDNATILLDTVAMSETSANASTVLDLASLSETSVNGSNITNEVPSDTLISLGIDPNITQSSLSSISNETFQQNATTLVAEQDLLNATQLETEATQTNVTVPITISNITSMEPNVTQTETSVLPVVSLSSNDTIDTSNTSATAGMQLPEYLPQPPDSEIPVTFSQDNQSTTVEIISPPSRNISSLTQAANGTFPADQNVSAISAFPDSVLSLGGRNISDNATFETHVVPSTKVSNISDIVKDNLTNATLSTVSTTLTILSTVASTSTATVTPARKKPVTEHIELVFDHPPPIFVDGRRPPSYPDQLETQVGPAGANTRQSGFQKPTTTDLPPPPPIFLPKVRSTPRYIVSHSTTTESPVWPAFGPPKTPSPENDPRYMTVAELTELAFTNVGSLSSEQQKGLQVFFNTIHPLTPEPVHTTTPMPSFEGPNAVFSSGTAAGPLNLPNVSPIKEPPKQFFGAEYLLNQIGIGETATTFNKQHLNVQKQQPQAQNRTGQSPYLENVPKKQIQQDQRQQSQNQLFQNQLQYKQQQQHVNNQQFQNQQQQPLNQQQLNELQQQPVNQQQLQNKQQPFQIQPKQPLNQQLFQNQQPKQPLNQQQFQNQQQTLNYPQLLNQQQNVNNQQIQPQYQHLKNQLQQPPVNKKQFQIQQRPVNQQPFNQEQQQLVNQQKLQNQIQQPFNQQFKNQQEQLQRQIQQLQEQQEQLKKQQQQFLNQQERLPNQKQQQQQFENQLRLFQQQNQQRQFQSQPKTVVQQQQQQTSPSNQFFDSDFLLQQIAQESKDFTNQLSGAQGKPNQVSLQRSPLEKLQNIADWQKTTQKQWQYQTTPSHVDTYTPSLTQQQKQQQRPFRTSAVTENPFTPFIKTGDLFLAQSLDAWIKSMAMKPEIIKQVRNDNMNMINNNLKAIQQAPRSQLRPTTEVIHERNLSPSLIQTNLANDRNVRTSQFKNTIRGYGLTLQRPRPHVYGITETTTQAMPQQWQQLNNKAASPQVNGPFNPMNTRINPQGVLDQQQPLNARTVGNQVNRLFNPMTKPINTQPKFQQRQPVNGKTAGNQMNRHFNSMIKPINPQAVIEQRQPLNGGTAGNKVNQPFNPMIEMINPQGVLEQRQPFDDRPSGHQINRPFNPMTKAINPQTVLEQRQPLNDINAGNQMNRPFNPMNKPINTPAQFEQRQPFDDRTGGHQRNPPFNHAVNPPMQTGTELSQAGGIDNPQLLNPSSVGNQWPFSNRIGFGSVLPNPTGFSNFDLNLAATKQFNMQPSIITDTGVKTHIIPARTIPETQSHWSSKANNSIKLSNVHVPYFMKTEANQGTTVQTTSTMSLTSLPVRRMRFTTSTIPTVPPTVDPNPPAIFDTKVLQTFMPFPKPGDTTRPPKGEAPGQQSGETNNTNMKDFDNRCTDCVFVNDRCLLPDTTHCSMFIECVRQGHMVRAFNRECALGAFFDRKSFLCVDPKNTDCPQDRCREPGLKWYPIHGHCKHYWSCASREGGGIYAQSECCPDMGGFVEGAGCVENPNCTESCDSVINTAPSTGCHLRKTAVPQIYFDTNANIERPCAPGTLFNEPKCTCEQDVTIERSKNRPGAGSCLPMLAVTFDNMTVADTSNNRQHVGIEGVGTTQRGEGIFNGASRLVLWRYANLMFPFVFAVRFSFFGATGGPRYQTVLSNCDPKSGRIPTFEISLDTVYHEVIFKVDTLKGTRKVFKQIYQHTKWTTVVLIYDGERIVGSVDTRARNIIAGGGIETRPTPISVGACGGQDGLKGLMENLSIYEDCIPDDMYGIFMSVLE